MVVKALNSINTFLWSLIALFVIGGIVLGGFYFVKIRYADQFALRDAQAELENAKAELEAAQTVVAEQREAIAALNVEVERLDLSLRLLKTDHRLAYIEVVDQNGAAETNDLTTRFRFVEVDEENEAEAEPREFQIEGNRVYVDSRVIKFKDELIETGDPLRSTSICIFDRLFSEKMSPEEGFLLDKEGIGPTAYRTGGELTQYEQDLWARFWEYASDPKMADEAGIRAAHGDAPSTLLVPGVRYELKLRASDGLTITPQIIDEPEPNGGPTT